MSVPDFDWTLMRSFLAVIEAGSLLGAARKLGTTQPTVGRHVAQLEAQLGCALFERTGRGLAPTRIAQRIAGHARQMSDGADAVARTLSAAREDLSGTVRVSASHAVAFRILPPIVARLRAAHPQVQVEVQSTDLVANLVRREADIAVRMVAPEQSNVVARRLGSSKVGAYASVDYIARRGQPATPAELLDHDLVGLIDDAALLRGFADAGIAASREHFAVRCADPLVTWQAVRAGLGIGFFVDSLARHDPALVSVLPEVGPWLPVWLVVHNEIRGNPAIRAVYDFLGAELQREFAPAPAGDAPQDAPLQENA